MAIAVLLMGGASSQQEVFETQKLIAPGPGDYFGGQLVLDGDTALITSNNLSDSKATVWAWRLDGSAWIADGELPVPSDSEPGDGFGTAVALDGDQAIVGSNTYNNSEGRATVYVRSGRTWIEEGELLALDGMASDFFGRGVAIDGDTAMVGADSEGPGSAGNVGAIYVFQRIHSNWRQVQKLTLSDGTVGDYFGNEFEFQGDTMLAGVMNKDNGPSYDEGFAYVFERSAGGLWIEVQKLVAPDGTINGKFGFDVALDGDVAVVGSKGHGAYVFRRGLVHWFLEQKLWDPQPSVGSFGYSVAVRHDLLLVADAVNDPLSPASGFVSVFRPRGTSWIEESRLQASDAGVGDLFGGNVAIAGNSVLVAASSDDFFVQYDSLGSVHAFDLSPDAWPSLGFALPGTAGPPVLHVSGQPAPGAALVLTLDHAPPLASATLVLGLSLLEAPFKGGLLVPQPDAIIAGPPADSAGHLELSTHWPPGVPAQQTFALQGWLQDPGAPQGFAASNAVAVVSP